MVVRVHLHTILQRNTPQGTVRDLQVSLAPGSTLLDLNQQLEIELEIEYLLLVVNGRIAEPDQVLNDGDEVNLMPAISGG